MLIILIVLGFLGCALIGLITTFVWLGRLFTGRQRADADTSTTSLASPTERRNKTKYCPNCGAASDAAERSCSTCGWPKASTVTDAVLRELAATAHGVERLHRSERIDETTYTRVLEAVAAERTHLLAQPDAEPDASSAVTPPTTSPTVTSPPIVTARPLHGSPVPGSSAMSIPELPSQAPQGITPVASATAATSATRFQPPARPSDEPAVAPTVSRQSFTEVFASFMEERNIRWGELVGGLLIIGCSSALVVSLWSSISEIPTLKFFLFTIVTAALFSIGLYTEHRWKLPTTSRGVLIIATLLVPLNFLAIAAASDPAALVRGTAPGRTSSLVLLSELLAPIVFLPLVYYAGRTITPRTPHLLAVGVLGSSLVQLLVRHFAGSSITSTQLLMLGALPVICYGGTIALLLGAHIKRLQPSTLDDQRQVNSSSSTKNSSLPLEPGAADEILITLGAATFAAVLSGGLLLFKAGLTVANLNAVAPLLALGGVPLLACGLVLRQRLANTAMAQMRTAGTSLAIVGALTSLASIGLAWPDPFSITLAALLCFVLFTVIAARLPLPLAHAPAALCLAIFYTVGFYAVRAGATSAQAMDGATLTRALLSITSGGRLVGLCVLLVLISEWLMRRQQTRETVDGKVSETARGPVVTASRCYAGAACVVASLSFLIVTRDGFNVPGDPHGIRFVYGLYAIIAFVLAWRHTQILLAWVGSVLLLFALGQTIDARFHVSYGWQAALLAHSSLTLLASTLIKRRRLVEQKAAASAAVNTGSEQPRFDNTGVNNILVVLDWSTLGSSVVAVALLLADASGSMSTGSLAGRVFWLAAVWLGVSLTRRSRSFVALFQISATVGVVLAVTATLKRAAWYVNAPDGWFQPWSLQAYGCALALLVLAWTALRYVTFKFAANQNQHAHFDVRAKGNTASQFLASSGDAVERGMTVLLVAGFVLLSIYAAAPGVAQELLEQQPLLAPNPSNSQLSVLLLPHRQALGAGSWALLALLLGVLLGNLFTSTSKRLRRLMLLGAVLIASCACPLLAGRWESQVATATAWRWLAAGFLAVGSIPLLFRDTRTKRLAASPSKIKTSLRSTTEARLLLCIVTLAPLLLFTFYAASATITLRPVIAPTADSFFTKLGNTASYLIPLLVASGALIAHSVRERRYLYLASITINLGATWWWAATTARAALPAVSNSELWIVNAAALALLAVGWLLLDRYVPIAATAPTNDVLAANERSATSSPSSSSWPAFHHVAAIVSAAIVTGVAITGLLADFSASSTATIDSPSALLSVVAMSSVIALMIACLWDARARFAVPGVYVLGLTATGMSLDYFNLAPRQLGATAMLALAAYAVATSSLWRMREQLNAIWRRLHLARQAPRDLSGITWFVQSHLLIVFTVTLLGGWVALTFTNTPWRFLAAFAVLMQALALGLLVEAEAATEQADPLTVRRAAFVPRLMFSVLAVSAILFGWASLSPTGFATSLASLHAVDSDLIPRGALLNYLVMTMIVLLSTAALYGAASDKLLIRESVWTQAAHALVPYTAALSLISLLLVIGTEAVYRINSNRIDIHPLAIAVMIATLVGLCLMSLLFAIIPERDPLNLSERGRTGYVYAAEVFLTLLFVHIRLTMPWLFSGFFSRYWPIVVIVLAFLGVGASELLRRQSRNVLAEPLERTGILLPLLPVVGFWAISSEVNYSGVLFLVGLLYGVLSIMRQSFLFAVLAALAGNGGVWYVLHHTSGYNFLAHPQLWLVPLAFSVLVASHLHRDQLSAEALRTVRYTTLMMIYVSSTADIFINGVAGSMWLPLMLAGLSVAGVFAGILLRVQAYLFLGTAFLTLAVLTMIWHASVNFGWTWLWYVAGIVLGVFIIGLFALFEKKRGEMLRLVDELRAWER